MQIRQNDIDTDQALIEAVLKGHQPAFRQLVERHQDYAFTLAMRILNQREEAEEAAQDAFVRAYKALPNFQKEAKFTTWLYRIVLNCALSIQQRRKAATFGLENAAILRGEEPQPLKQQEQRFYIQKSLALLAADDAAVISLFYLKEQSLEEISTTLGIEANTVKVKLHRARKRLAETLQEMLKGEARGLV